MPINEFTTSVQSQFLDGFASFLNVARSRVYIKGFTSSSTAVEVGVKPPQVGSSGPSLSAVVDQMNQVASSGNFSQLEKSINGLAVSGIQVASLPPSPPPFPSLPPPPLPPASPQRAAGLTALNAGAVSGIVIGCVLGCALLALIGGWLVMRRKSVAGVTYLKAPRAPTALPSPKSSKALNYNTGMIMRSPSTAGQIISHANI